MRIRSGTWRVSTVMFAMLFFAIPFALLASIPVWILAAVMGGLGVGFVGLGRLPIERTELARNIAKGFLLAAAILTITHFTGWLEPFYRRDGWLLLDMETSVMPQSASPGDSLHYTLTTTNTEGIPALRRRYFSDGVAHHGVLLYCLLPTRNGDGFPLEGMPSATQTAKLGGTEHDVGDCTIVYAHLPIPELNPGGWDWSSTYREGMDVIGMITSDGQQHRDLEPGDTIRLEFTLSVPLDHPAGPARSARGSLSYRDPQWATHYIQELRFPFRDRVTVMP